MGPESVSRGIWRLGKEIGSETRLAFYAQLEAKLSRSERCTNLVRRALAGTRHPEAASGAKQSKGRAFVLG